MSSLSKRKVNRDLLYEEIKKIIEQSPDKEAELSSSRLAVMFNVQPPTMDYHLKKLVEEGLLVITQNRGRFNRKKYRLPSKENSEQTKTDIHIPSQDVESAEKFLKFIEDFISNEEKKEEEKKEKINDDNSSLEEKEEASEEEENKQFTKKELMNQIPLTLDEKIERFLNKSKEVHKAEDLLKHEDREILSVMSETIHQTIIYLKDLSEQLSTVEDKQMIQALIDDRNRLIEQVEKLEDEVSSLREHNQNSNQNEIDPQRVRFMQQVLISTVDDFINLPNPAIALNRREFRNKISKEISDLVNYVLKLEG